MASQFIGLHMRVVLREPSAYQLTGTVRDVEAGSCLTLTNGMGVRLYVLGFANWCPVFVSGTKEWHPHMTISASNIADLQEIKTDDAPNKYVTPPVAPVAAPVPAAILSRPPVQPAFVDPAILSLGRRPHLEAHLFPPSKGDPSTAWRKCRPVSPARYLPFIHRKSQ